MNQAQIRRMVDRLLLASLLMAGFWGGHTACDPQPIPPVRCPNSQRVILTPLFMDGGVANSDGGQPDGGMGPGSDPGKDLNQQCNDACLLIAGTAHQMLFRAKLVTDDPSGRPACDCSYGLGIYPDQCSLP